VLVWTKAPLLLRTSWSQSTVSRAVSRIGDGQENVGHGLVEATQPMISSADETMTSTDQRPALFSDNRRIQQDLTG